MKKGVFYSRVDGVIVICTKDSENEFFSGIVIKSHLTMNVGFSYDLFRVCDFTKIVEPFALVNK